MQIHGFSSNLYGWFERYGKEATRAQILHDCRLAGLDAVEATASPETMAILKAEGLRLSGNYIGVQLHEDWSTLPVEQELLPHARRTAEGGGTDWLVNADPKGGWAAKLPKTEVELKRQGENLTRLADLAAPLGLKLCFHNHADTKEGTEGDLRSVVEYTGANVGLCVDTGWAWVSGCDPVEWVRRYPKRIRAFHLRNQRGRVPTEDLLEGDIDFRALVAAMREIRYEGWLALELWHPPETNPQRTMMEDVSRSIAFLKQIITD